MEKKEAEYTINVLKTAEQALLSNDSFKLKELSDQKIHTASSLQDITSIALIIILYSLSKLVERKDRLKIRNWNKFVKKFNFNIDLAVKALEQNDYLKYQESILRAKKAMESISPNLKNYIKEVLQKASINKAYRLYEHGLSLGQTAKLLGLTQWELLDYTGQTTPDSSLPQTLEVKKRAQMALEFLS